MLLYFRTLWVWALDYRARFRRSQILDDLEIERREAPLDPRTRAGIRRRAIAKAFQQGLIFQPAKGE